MPSKKIGFGFFVIALGISFIVANCGKKAASGGSSISSFASTYPYQNVVASITASTSGGGASLTRDHNVLWSALNVVGLLKLLKIVGVDFTEAATTPAAGDDSAPPSALVSEMKNNLNAPPATTAGLVNLNFGTKYSDCYGPSFTENSTGSNVLRPSGDLGMWSASAASGEACAASEINTLMSNNPTIFNNVLRLNTAIIAAASANGESIPAVGSTTTLSSADLPTLSGASAFKVTAATITRLNNDASGNPIYKTVITLNNGSITFWHDLQAADNSKNLGLCQIVITATGNVTSSMGMSVLYQNDGTNLTEVIESGINRGANSTDFFSTTTGRVDPTKAASGQSLTKLILILNPTTNAGTLHHCWMAGNQDRASRCFAATVSMSGGSLSGFAYYGYGSTIQTLADTTTTIWPSQMYCDWLHPSSSPVTGVQGQTFHQNTTTGKFVADTSDILYAPTSTCDCGSTYTISGNPTYNGTVTCAAHSFTTPTGLGTVPAVTIPTFTPPAS